MAENEFTPITSQEALDAVLKDRLTRQNDKHSKELADIKAQYADYDELKASKEGFEVRLGELTDELTKANDKITGYDSQIAEKDEQIKNVRAELFKEKAVRTYNLSDDAIEFLKGDTEEDIMASAVKLSKLAPKTVVAPLAGAEPKSDGKTEALKTMLSSLNLGGK